MGSPSVLYGVSAIDELIDATTEGYTVLSDAEAVVLTVDKCDSADVANSVELNDAATEGCTVFAEREAVVLTVDKCDSTCVEKAVELSVVAAVLVNVGARVEEVAVSKTVGLVVEPPMEECSVLIAVGTEVAMTSVVPIEGESLPVGIIRSVLGA